MEVTSKQHLNTTVETRNKKQETRKQETRKQETRKQELKQYSPQQVDHRVLTFWLQKPATQVPQYNQNLQ